MGKIARDLSGTFDSVSAEDSSSLPRPLKQQKKDPPTMPVDERQHSVSEANTKVKSRPDTIDGNLVVLSGMLRDPSNVSNVLHALKVLTKEETKNKYAFLTEDAIAAGILPVLLNVMSECLRHRKVQLRAVILLDLLLCNAPCRARRMLIQEMEMVEILFQTFKFYSSDFSMQRWTFFIVDWLLSKGLKEKSSIVDKMAKAGIVPVLLNAASVCCGNDGYFKQAFCRSIVNLIKHDRTNSLRQELLAANAAVIVAQMAQSDEEVMSVFRGALGVEICRDDGPSFGIPNRLFLPL